MAATVARRTAPRLSAPAVPVPRERSRPVELVGEVVVGVQLAIVSATADLDDLGRATLALGGIAAIACAIAVSGQRDGRARGVAVLLAGWAGVVTGAGIGAVHLAVEGPSP